MGSTDNPTQEIAQAFDRSVVPAAEALRDRGVLYFALAPSSEPASYFATRTRRTLEPRDFEWPVIRTHDELAAHLRELWAGQPELLQLIDTFVRLAKQPDPSDEGDGSVSGLVYAMY